ncbi:MAG: hypothetical protein H6Q69_953 [Firmicutes bacterium]|nr:hypothetical protein [Bacillota bacterium]
MLEFDDDLMRKILTNELNYSMVDEVIPNFHKNLDSRLQHTLDVWLFERTIIDEINVEGVTIRYIMEKEGYSFIDALVSMSIYLNNPAKARWFFDTPKSFFIRMCGGISEPKLKEIYIYDLLSCLRKCFNEIADGYKDIDEALEYIKNNENDEMNPKVMEMIDTDREFYKKIVPVLTELQQIATDVQRSFNTITFMANKHYNGADTFYRQAADIKKQLLVIQNLKRKI